MEKYDEISDTEKWYEENIATKEEEIEKIYIKTKRINAKITLLKRDFENKKSEALQLGFASYEDISSTDPLVSTEYCMDLRVAPPLPWFI